ncbi:MAG: outer membrane beta-barrel protein [Prolixibacteraceae bacterium]|nr:outer membrane beta-barrel protein [Prolixibacteraceae bacterium]
MNSIKISWLFFIVVFPLFINGQNSESQTSKKLSFGVNFSPDYSYRRLYQENDEHNFVDYRNEIEDPRLGFTTGLVAYYQISNRFTFESGIQFSDKGEKSKFTRWIVSSGNSATDPAFTVKSKSFNHYYYLGVPIKLNYFLLQKQFRLFISGGISTDFFLSGKIKYIDEFNDRTERGSENMDYDFNIINFVGLASLGIERDISTKLSLRVEPTFRYSFTPVAIAPMERYPYSFGANVVLFYSN